MKALANEIAGRRGMALIDEKGKERPGSAGAKREMSSSANARERAALLEEERPMSPTKSRGAARTPA